MNALTVCNQRTGTKTGADRFELFRAMIRAEGLKMTCEGSAENLQLWSIYGPAGFTRVCVILDDHGFDFFFDSGNIRMEDDVAEVARRVGARA